MKAYKMVCGNCGLEVTYFEDEVAEEKIVCKWCKKENEHKEKNKVNLKKFEIKSRI